MCCRLDQLHKQLLQRKEELLKESKAKLTTMDGVKTQIDGLMKVRPAIVVSATRLVLVCSHPMG